jgi:hypothetical protein
MSDGDYIGMAGYRFAVSDMNSPFAAELELAEEKPKTLPPRLSITVQKLRRVRALGS